MKKPFFYLRTRIFLVMILLVFISFLLIGVSTNFQILESSNYYHELRLERKEAQLQKAISYELEESKIENAQNAFKNELGKIAMIQNISFNIYDLDGSIMHVISNVRENEDETNYQFPSIERIDSSVLNKIKSSEKLKYVDIIKADDLNLRQSYSYILDNNNNPIWILNLPYFDDDNLNAYEIRSFIFNIIQVYLLLFVLAIIISYFISSYITSPVSQIAYMMKRLTIDKSNKKIDLDVNSREMHALVQSYNEMVDQIDNNVKELAKNQRELAWREMAKQVAHEIKNPLTPMKLSVQNFKLKFDPNDPQINSKLEDFSKTLVQQIDVLSSIATAFSSFAEFPDQKNEFIDFAEEIQLCLEIFNDHDIKFIKPKEKIQGNFDKSNLVRIVTNLVKNSIQATSELNNPNIEIELKKIDSNIELKISDNGSGIPTSLKEKIFEPNFTTKNKGTGLGLSIIKKLIDSYNGKIGFTSKAGKTIFKITVPTT